VKNPGFGIFSKISTKEKKKGIQIETEIAQHPEIRRILLVFRVTPITTRKIILNSNDQ
jgi:hypothetical protein